MPHHSDLIDPGNVVVTREEFNHWLSGEKELITTLDDSEWLGCRTAESTSLGPAILCMQRLAASMFGQLGPGRIDLSCKSDLFDVLDADLSGELEFEEPFSCTKLLEFKPRAALT